VVAVCCPGGDANRRSAAQHSEQRKGVCRQLEKHGVAAHVEVAGACWCVEEMASKLTIMVALLAMSLSMGFN